MTSETNVEIERKFLVCSDEWRDEVTTSAKIEQGYVAVTETVSVRIRRYGDRAFLTVKGRREGVSRLEVETEVPIEFVESLLRSGLLESATVVKTRHLVPAGVLTFEVDEFEGPNRGLVIAELELPDAAAEFPRPRWLGEEVSEDDRYANTYLSRHPYGEW